MMDKILIFCPNFGFYGVERGLMNLLKALRGKFALIVVIPANRITEARIKEVDSSIKIKKIPLPVLRISLSPYYFCKFIFLSFILPVYFLFYIKRNKIKLVLTNSLTLIFPAFVCRLAKKSHIWYLREFFAGSKANKLLSAVIKISGSRLVCQSKEIRRRLFLPAPVKVVYEPMDESNYKIYPQRRARRSLGLPEKGKIVCLPGRIHPAKGQYEFLAEFMPVLEKNRNIILFLAGDITCFSLKNILYKKRIKKIAAGSKSGNVFFLGFQKNIGRVLSAADCAVFPFRKSEPYGIAIAEALSFGKACFFPPRGGAKEIRRIYGGGYPLEAKKIKEYIEGLPEHGHKEGDNFYIPPELKFDFYKQNISKII